MLDACRRLIEAGNLGEAEARLTHFVRSDPDSVEAATLLGIVFAKSGRWDLASDQLEFALRKPPESLEALTWMAVVRRSQGRPEVAAGLLYNVLAQKRDDPELFNLLGMCLLTLGRAEEAETAFRSAIDLQPDSAPAHSNLGMALRLQTKGAEALEAFQKALSLSPGEAQSYLQVFKQLQQLSQWNEALEILETGIKNHPGSIPLAEALASTYGRLNRPGEAEAIFLRISGSNVAAANSYAAWLQEQGRFADSSQVLERSLRLQPVQGVPYRLFAEAKQFDLDGRPLLVAALQVFEDPRLDETGRMHLSYALGKLHELSGNFGAAMNSFDLANSIAYRIYPRSRTFDPDWTAREPELMAELYTKEFIERLSAIGDPDRRPIFIVGMIRSGTTLLDQIVSSHPDVMSVGEGTYWNAEADSIHPRWRKEEPSGDEVRALAEAYLDSVGIAHGSGRFTDKMPLNYRHLGLMSIVFPNARFLHIKRDPFDTCLSIYTTFFAGGPNFAYNQENIVAFYRSYLRHMEHLRQALPSDRFFELDYESLVADPEPITHAVLEFLGLPWNDACLRHESNREQVSTPSRWQARQPIYTTSTGKRQNYGPDAGALAQL